MPDGTICTHPDKGIFCYWNESENGETPLRFFIDFNSNSLVWNAGYGNYKSDYSMTSTPWNINYKNLYEPGKKHYYTITLNTKEVYNIGEEEYYKQIVYMDGNKLYEGNYNKKTWDYFINNYLNDLKCFCIGRAAITYAGSWHYSKMNVYTLKLYNRGLSEEEVKDNYNKSLAYHNALL